MTFLLGLKLCFLGKDDQLRWMNSLNGKNMFYEKGLKFF